MNSNSLKGKQIVTDKGRNYGIDLLRLVLMFMVCILHTLGQGGVLGASDAGTNEYKVYWFIEILSYCAVDGFALISGYIASNKPRKYERIVDMWFQAFFYSFLMTALMTIVGLNETWLKMDMLKCALPVTCNIFWYFTSFFALFFAIPILNKFLFSIEEDVARKTILIIIVLFSVMGVFYDPFKSSRGYSAIWLIVLYSLGVLAKRIRLFETRRSITLIIWWAMCIVLTWIALIKNGSHLLINYVSPTILLSGLIMVVIFSRLQLKGTFISKLSPLAFGIYLYQMNPIIWHTYLNEAFSSTVEKPLMIGILLVFAYATAIFISGLAVEFLRSKLATAFRINKLSSMIVTIADIGLKKLFFILK